MLKNVSLFCFFMGFCAAAYVDNLILSKCSIKDQDCLKNLYPNMIEKIAGTGIPELEIPVLEPLTLTDVTIPFLGVLNITLIKGTVTGISRCTFDVFTVDFEKGSGHQENTCSFTIEGQYRIDPSIIVDSVLGKGGIGGEGNAKITIDKLHISFDFPSYIQKRDDGETYIKVEYNDDIKYDYEIKGGLEVSADSIYLGGLETSKTIVPVINHNWKFLLRTFGKPIIDTAAGIFFKHAGKFFNKVPTKDYISDDLSSIAKP